jgi:hypothetical protein
VYDPDGGGYQVTREVVPARAKEAIDTDMSEKNMGTYFFIVLSWKDRRTCA